MPRAQSLTAFTFDDRPDPQDVVQIKVVLDLTLSAGSEREVSESLRYWLGDLKSDGDIEGYSVRPITNTPAG